MYAVGPAKTGSSAASTVRRSTRARPIHAGVAERRTGVQGGKSARAESQRVTGRLGRCERPAAVRNRQVPVTAVAGTSGSSSRRSISSTAPSREPSCSDRSGCVEQPQHPALVLHVLVGLVLDQQVHRVVRRDVRVHSAGDRRAGADSGPQRARGRLGAGHDLVDAQVAAGPVVDDEAVVSEVREVVLVREPLGDLLDRPHQRTTRTTPLMRLRHQLEEPLGVLRPSTPYRDLLAAKGPQISRREGEPVPAAAELVAEVPVDHRGRRVQRGEREALVRGTLQHTRISLLPTPRPRYSGETTTPATPRHRHPPATPPLLEVPEPGCRDHLVAVDHTDVPAVVDELPGVLEPLLPIAGRHHSERP